MRLVSSTLNYTSAIVCKLSCLSQARFKQIMRGFEAETKYIKQTSLNQHHNNNDDDDDDDNNNNNNTAVTREQQQCTASATDT